jgi:lipoprotein NlpI
VPIVRRILLAALAGVVAMAEAMLVPSPAAALTRREIGWCVSAFVQNPKGSACLAAIQSLRCSNLDNLYEREVQISACTEASESASWTSESLAEIFINRGTAYQVNDDRDNAIADYSQAIRLDPYVAVAFYDRGQVYQDKGDLEHAIADYRKAIDIDPNFSSAFTELGSAYQRKRDFDRAIAHYSEAIRLGRGKDGAFSAFDAFYGRATAYRAKGEFDRAIADFSEAIRLTPDDRAFINRGLAYLAKGDLDRAVADFKETFDDDSEDPRPYLFFGILRLYSGWLSPAVSDLTYAWENSDDDAYAALWLDIARERAHRPSRLAKVANVIAIDKWPGPIVRLYLGEITKDAVLAAADDPDADTKTTRLCEANFFAGELALRRDVKDEAESLLRRATAPDCGIIIAWATNAELKSLGAPPLNEFAGRPVADPPEKDEFPRMPIAKSPPPMPAPPVRSPSVPARTMAV